MQQRGYTSLSSQSLQSGGGAGVTHACAHAHTCANAHTKVCVVSGVRKGEGMRRDYDGGGQSCRASLGKAAVS